MKNRVVDSADRRALLDQQTQLIQYLMSDGAKPDEIGSEILGQASKDALLRKRRRAVERCNPSLVAELGMDHFRTLFSEFAAKYPGVHEKGPCADARLFNEFVCKETKPQDWVWRLVHPILGKILPNI